MSLDDNYASFLASVKKLNCNRKHKVTNSLGVYDAYKWLRKRKWEDIGRAVTEHDFYKIIRGVNNLFAETLIHGGDVKFPQRMGKLELRKFNASISLREGKIVTNLPVDWNKTLELWYEDKDAYNNKTLIRIEEKEMFKIYYNKHSASYNNMSFYKFIPNTELRKSLKSAIKDYDIDAFNLK
jgi:hypothetical protein